MTVLVAIWDGVKVYAASDTKWSAHGRTSHYCPKWIMNEPYAVGVCGSATYLQMVYHGQTRLLNGLTPNNALETAWRFRTNFLSFAVEYGLPPTQGKNGMEVDCSLLLASPKFLIEYDSGLGYEIAKENQFVALGTGSDHARGAYHALWRLGERNPKLLVQASATAAIDDPEASLCGGEVWYNEFV